MLKMREKYAPGRCAYDGKYHEVRWDLSGCNLRCLFCWSPASIPEVTHDPVRVIQTSEIVAETAASLRQHHATFIRFTGGEPTLQWTGVAEVFSELHRLRHDQPPPILIQTNGIAIGEGTASLEVLKATPGQRYLFELSIKGTNAAEFALLTGREPTQYRSQLRGLAALKSLSAQVPNVEVVAVLGVYHSSTRGPSKYAFVDPSDSHLLFEDPSRWDPDFRNHWSSASVKWVEPLRMSPLGVWNSLYRRCGPSGAGILRNFPGGTATNCQQLFPAKPKTAEYAHRLVTGWFW